MATYRELLSRIDLLLGEPHPAAPSTPTRWEVFRGVVQLATNTALNSSVAWLTRSTTIAVTEGQDTYSINASDFGKDILVETMDTGNADHVARPVSRASLQSQPYTSFPQSGEESTSSGTMHTARVMAFFRENGEVKVRVMPMPTQSATYKIYYETAGANDDSDSNALFSPAGESYIVALTALNLLPYCQWAGISAEEAKQKKRELTTILAASVATHEKAWKIYIATDRQAGVVRLRGFDDEGEEMAANW